MSSYNVPIDESIYPMPMFTTLTVSDFARSESFYHAAGFITLAKVPGPDNTTAVVHLRRRRYQDLLLVAGTPSPGNSRITFSAHEEDLDALATSLSAVAENPDCVSQPEDTAWFTTDLNCIDPDSYHLSFTRQRPQDQHAAAQWAESFDMPEHH